MTLIAVSSVSPAGSAPVSLDPDAQLLFNAVEAEPGAVLTTVQKAATNNLFLQLKNASVNMYADYISEGWLYLGENLAGGKHSLKLNFPITWGSAMADINVTEAGFVSLVEGITNHGGSYEYIPNVELPSAVDTGFIHHSVITQATGQSIEWGVGGNFRTVTTSNGIERYVQLGSASLQEIFGSIALSGGITAAMLKGGTFKQYQNGVENGSVATGSNTLPAGSLRFGQTMIGTFTSSFVFKSALTPAQVAEFNVILSTWITAMNRTL